MMRLSLLHLASRISMSCIQREHISNLTLVRELLPISCFITVLEQIVVMVTLRDHASSGSAHQISTKVVISGC